MKKCIVRGIKISTVLLCCCILNVGCGAQAYRGDKTGEVISIEFADDGQGNSGDDVEEQTQQPEVSDMEEQAQQPEVSDKEEQPELPEQYSADWSEERLLEEIGKRSRYREHCSFYSEWVNYMENVREVRDISMYIEPLYATDTKAYSMEDFEGVPPLILHLAKNEIYARHGYIFQDTDLYNYFMMLVWYLPEVTPGEFDDGVFNETERHNLDILKELDTY